MINGGTHRNAFMRFCHGRYAAVDRWTHHFLSLVPRQPRGFPITVEEWKRHPPWQQRILFPVTQVNWNRVVCAPMRGGRPRSNRGAFLVPGHVGVQYAPQCLASPADCCLDLVIFW